MPGTAQGFTHKHVPLEVTLNKKITKLDENIFWIVQSITGAGRDCWASNEYFSELLKVASGSVSRSIARLIDLGYLKSVHFDGRRRYLEVDISHEKKYKHLTIIYNKKAYENIIKSNSSKKLLTEKLRPPRQTRQTDRYKDRSPSSSPPSLLRKKGKERTTTFAEKRANVGDTSFKPSSKKRSRRVFKKLDRDKLVDDPKANSIFDYWNTKSPVVTKHKRDTKIHSKAIEELVRLLKRHSTREIRSRIDKYCDLLIASERGVGNPHMLWINKKMTGVKVSLPDFLKDCKYNYNSKLKLKGESWFEECSKPAPELIEKFSLKLKDKNPIYTHHIKSQWENKGLSKGRDLTVFDENNFIVCAGKLMTFVKKNKSRIRSLDRRTPEQVDKGSHKIAIDMARRLFASIIASNGNVKNSGYICQNFAFNEFEQYLINNGIMNPTSSGRRRDQKTKAENFAQGSR